MTAEDEKITVPRQEQIREAVAACTRLLQERFDVRRVIPFGSIMAPDRWHARSDIDLAVEGLAPELFWKAWADLTEVVPRGVSVDLVSLETARPELRARILGGEPVAQHPLEAIKGIVADEMEALAQIQRRVDTVLAESEAEPGQVELMALAGYIHGFYTGMESILERLVVALDEGLPRGEQWHADLLTQVVEPRPGHRPAVIDEPLRAHLREYLRFRHFFRHAYSTDLEWHKLRPLVEGMQRVLASFRTQVESFLEEMSPET